MIDELERLLPSLTFWVMQTPEFITIKTNRGTKILPHLRVISSPTTYTFILPFTLARTPLLSFGYCAVNSSLDML